jgi:hypothetical protein
MKSNKSYVPKTQAMNVLTSSSIPHPVPTFFNLILPLYKWFEKKVMGMFLQKGLTSFHCIDPLLLPRLQLSMFFIGLG